jgi:ZIP family zinc transporter
VPYDLLILSACVFGASIIYVEYIVRLFPSQKQFRIQDSNVFLACSFSLSFGVMVRQNLTPGRCDYYTDS